MCDIVWVSPQSHRTDHEGHVLTKDWMLMQSFVSTSPSWSVLKPNTSVSFDRVVKLQVADNVVSR